MLRSIALAALTLLGAAAFASANTPARRQPISAEPPRDWPGDLDLVEVTIPANGCRVWVPQRNAGQHVVWTGACPNGIADGLGKLVMSSAEFYEGTLRSGKMDDERGNLEWWGLRYNGGFRQGHLTGAATLSWTQLQRSPGLAYKGAFVDGLAQGRGELVGLLSRSGGEFRNGKLNGQGFVERPGYRYEGGLVDDRPNGVGIEVAGIYRYEGGFSRGRFSGRGVFERDGERQEGTFREGGLSGLGIQLLPDGTRYEGMFSQGQRYGYGVLTMPDGGRYEGDFLNGGAHGSGLYTAPDGKRYDGIWKAGCFSDGGRRAAVITPMDLCSFE